MSTTFLHKPFALCRNLDEETRTIDKNQELKNKGKNYKTKKNNGCCLRKTRLLFKENNGCCLRKTRLLFKENRAIV